ncbi:hypothetical protein Syun_013601 [Stephania yunnanensis]|uniref:Transmembrane protein 135 N-terminal domain-containing protein n=1 Tax=Stephania yunnanensis TaxID=152371 RepID=A0AAP0JHR2_9MAGN
MPSTLIESERNSGKSDGSQAENGTNAGDRSSSPRRKTDLSSSSSSSSASPCSCSCSSFISGNDLEKLWWRLVMASSKGFAIGAGLKGGLAAFSVLARFMNRRQRRGGVVLSGDATGVAVKETLRYGLFLGTFAGIFVSVDEFIAALGGKHRIARWRSLLAGAVAGPSMLLTGYDTQHTSLAIYILMRALVLASRCGIKSKRFGGICKPLSWSHGDLFLMCLSSSQILSAYILDQESLPASYKSFLNKHGGKDSSILQGVKEIASGKPFTNLEAIEKHYKSLGVNIKLNPEMKVPCTMVHGGKSCTSHVLSFLAEAYGRALPVYLPVYLIPALIVHRQGLLPRPYTILGKSLFGIARSSLFLSVYCSSAWMWTCLLFRIFKTCNIPMVAIGTFPPGLALAIEKKSRRIEISLYCFARAIESFFACLSKADLLPKSTKLKRADVIVFSFSTAIIMHCYAQEREVFRSKYLNVLDWVFGVPSSPTELDGTQVSTVKNNEV